MRFSTPLAGLIASSVPLAVAADTTAPGDGAPVVHWPIDPLAIVLIGIFVFVGVMLWYVWGLRDRLANAITNDKIDAATRTSVLTGYADWPLGVPRGTVRAVLALIIVFGSVAFLGLSIALPDRYKFPDVIVGILGAVLGFYFGKSGSSTDSQATAAVAKASADAQAAREQANDAAAQTQQAQQQADQANQALSNIKSQHDSLANEKLDTITNDLQTAVQVGQVISTSLPGNIGKTVATATNALSNAVTAVSDLRKGDLSGAVQQASQIADQVAPSNPVVTVLSQAASAIGPVLGTSIPPIALLTTIITIGSKLASVAYAHWIARIMDEPYTPQQFSPTVFDSNSAVSVLMQVPTLMKIFGPRVGAGDRALALDVVTLALKGDGGAALLAKYSTDFAGTAQATLNGAVRDVQKAALSFLLTRELPPDAGASIGGPAAIFQAVDKVRANPTASAALDSVMTTAQALKQAGKHPEAEFTAAADTLAKSAQGKS